ncbi:hypothetical protein VPH35_030744 [Triticum aestivum]
MGADEDMVSEDPPSGKHHNYSHYHEKGGPTHFCKVILAPQLECIPMPQEFTENFPVVPQDFKLGTNTGCSWRIRIGYMVTFKFLTPDTLKVIVFNDEGIEVVTKCGLHDDAFAMNV